MHAWSGRAGDHIQPESTLGKMEWDMGPPVPQVATLRRWIVVGSGGSLQGQKPPKYFDVRQIPTYIKHSPTQA
jgi:hypothetical protein